MAEARVASTHVGTLRSNDPADKSSGKNKKGKGHKGGDQRDDD